MSTTLCIKYALASVSAERVTRIFNGLFGEKLVIQVTELIKDDRYKEGKKFKMFFIECDTAKQTKGNLDKLVRNITKNTMAKVTIDEHGHFWQVTFAREKAEFTPTLLEPTVEELEKAMEALQTKDELDFLHGKKRGAAEEGEITEPKRERISGVFEAEIAHNDPIYQEALRDTVNHFRSLFPEKA
jgi:polyribonucleotide nucleotidyltransferase